MIKKSFSGFTFIEMIIVVGVMGVIMASVLGVMTGTFRSQSRLKLTDKMNQTGIFALAEIRKGIINGISVGCPTDVGGSSFGYVDRSNGEITNIVCYEGSRIASESANNIVDLTNPDVAVINCGNFAKCNKSDSLYGTVTSVDINFVLATDINGVGLTKPYTSKIVIR